MPSLPSAVVLNASNSPAGDLDRDRAPARPTGTSSAALSAALRPTFRFARTRERPTLISGWASCTSDHRRPAQAGFGVGIGAQVACARRCGPPPGEGASSADGRRGQYGHVWLEVTPLGAAPACSPTTSSACAQSSSQRAGRRGGADQGILATSSSRQSQLLRRLVPRGLLGDGVPRSSPSLAGRAARWRVQLRR
jgi:hypothetical protein